MTIPDLKKLHRMNLVVGFLLVVITLSVYWPVMSYDFVNFDDNVYVYENSHIKEGISWEGIKWALTADLFSDAPDADFWIPVTFLSHLLTVEVFGLDPFGHHLVNLVLHVLNTLLLFGVFIRMTGGLWQSAVVAGLFAIHPLHVESVAWVTERKDVLSAVFLMLTLWAYVCYREQPGTIRYMLVMLAFSIGLTAKPMLVTLPFLLLLLDFWPLGRLSSEDPHPSTLLKSVWGLLYEKLPLFCLSVMSALITYLGVQRAEVVTSSIHLPIESRIANALISYVIYIRKMIWPTDLAVLYPHPGIFISFWKATGAALLLLAGSVIAGYAFRSRPYLGTGWLWFLGTLIPVIGIVQAGSQAMADRYTYIPLIGIFIMIAWGISDLVEGWPYRKPFLAAGVALLTLALMISTWQQVSHWKNSVTLFEQALRVTKNNSLAHYNLGMAYKDQGRVDEAIEEYTMAIKANPQHEGAHNNLGIALMERGRTDEAIRHYELGLAIKPDSAQAHNNLGEAYVEKEQYTNAAREFETVIELEPNLPQAHNNLASIYLLLNRFGEAIREYETAWELDPSPVVAYNLGIAYQQTGRFEEARRAFERALTIDPGFQQATRALRHLPE